MSKVDIGNFMGVIQATKNVEGGIEFPGEHMPSGRPVVSKGVTTGTIMGDKSMAEQRFESVKAQHEREVDEVNKEGSEESAPDLVIGGSDAAPSTEEEAHRQLKFIERRLKRNYKRVRRSGLSG